MANSDFRMDRTAFVWQSHEQEEKTKVTKTASYTERLKIATYLITVAYGLKDFKTLKVDRTNFSTRKL